MASVQDVEFFIYDPAKIGRHKIDIESSAKFPLAMTYSIKDVRDIASSKGTYSKTFQVPASKNNNRAFKMLFSDTYRDNDWNMAGLKECAVYVGGTEVVRGQCSIRSGSRKESPTHYEVQLFASNNQWVNELAAKYMCEIDFTVGQTLFPSISQDIDAVYDKAGIESTWEFDDADDAFMVYPLVNTGQWLYDTAEGILPENFYPAYFIRNLVHICFAQIGYTVESNFMETDWFKKQLVLPGKQEFSLSGSTISDHMFHVELDNSVHRTPWSRPQRICSRINAKVMPCLSVTSGIGPNHELCTYFEGGLRFPQTVTDPDNQASDGTIILPDFKLDYLETFLSDAMFVGWKWWGRMGQLRIIGAWEGSDNDGRDFGWIRCHDEFPSYGRAGEPIENSYKPNDSLDRQDSWKYRYYPWGSEKCLWPRPMNRYAMYTNPGTMGLTTTDLECQPFYNGATVNTNGHWNWFGINMCEVTAFSCKTLGIWKFSGSIKLELNIHSIWRWNRGFTSIEEDARNGNSGNNWEYTVPCWEPSLYWRAGLIPQDGHDNLGSGTGNRFTSFPMWKLHFFEGPMTHGLQIRGGDGSSNVAMNFYDRDIMYTGEKEKYNTNTYNPSFMRCGDRPECYVHQELPTTGSGQIEGDINAFMNPYSPWNLDWGGPSNPYDSCPLADWDAAGTSWYTWGENMCPMRANYNVTFHNTSGSPTGPYFNYNQGGDGYYTSTAGALVVPCWWNFRRSYITFRANVFLCFNRLNAAGDVTTNWDGRRVWDAHMVSTQVQDNSRNGWCMCSDDLCNEKSPYWNPYPGSTWNSSSNTHGCAIDCWWGDIDSEGGGDWSQECYTNPYGMSRSKAQTHNIIREGYRAMKTPDSSTDGNKSDIWGDPDIGPFCCDGSGDYPSSINPQPVPPAGFLYNPRYSVCQPFLPDNTKTTWDNIIPYADWDNTENMPAFGHGSDNLCRQTLKKPITDRLYANYSRYYNSSGAYTNEDPGGYYGGSGITFLCEFDDIELEVAEGEYAFMYSEVLEQLYEYGSTADTQGSIMGYNSRRTHYFGNWADPSINTITWVDNTTSPPQTGNSPGWNNTMMLSANQGFSLNMFSWCCHNDFEDGLDNNTIGWWIGAAFQCYGEGTCDDNKAPRYCGPTSVWEPCYLSSYTSACEDDCEEELETWGCGTEPGSSSLQNDWGRNFQAPGSRQGHNVWWGMQAMSVGNTYSGRGNGAGGPLYSHMAWEPRRVHFKKTSFRQIEPSWWKGELTDAILVGGTYPINDTLPCAETMLDFINGLTGLYNLYWTADQANKTIKVEPYNDFYSTPNNAISWKNKLDTSREIKNILSNDYLKREMCFTYKEDGADKLAVETHKLLDTPACHYGSFHLQLGDDFVNEEQMIGTKYYGPTLCAFDMTVALPEAEGFVPFIPFINKEYTTLANVFDNSELPEKLDKWKSRTLQWGGLQPMNRFTGELNVNNCLIMGDVRLNYPFGGTFDIQNGVGGNYTFGELNTGGRNWSVSLNYCNNAMIYSGDPASGYPNYNGPTAYGLYEVFWERQIESLRTRPKLKEAYFKLTPRDIATLDFSRLIHLEIGETDSYWAINKIIDYQPHQQGLTKVELLEYVNYSPIDKQGGGSYTTPEKGLYNQFVGFYASEKRNDYKTKVVASNSGGWSSAINKNLSLSRHQVPDTRAFKMSWENTKKRRKSILNAKGKKNAFLGSNEGPKNMGLKLIGDRIAASEKNQIGIGNTYSGADTMLSKNTQVQISAGGKDQITFRAGKLNQGDQRADEQIMVLNTTTGAYEPLFSFDVEEGRFPTIQGQLLEGKKSKVSGVYKNTYSRDVFSNNPTNPYVK